MYFIELTCPDGRKIKLRVDLIESYGEERKTCSGNAFIMMRNKDDCSAYVVMETMEEITELIQNITPSYYCSCGIDEVKE